MRDRYGDHGFCGVYVHDSEERELEHFAFSCRILGVERWLYRKLGRPRIEVRGEAPIDLDDPSAVDCIAQGRGGQSREARAAQRIARITARGSCDRLHFHRGALFKIYRRICASVFA